MTYSIAALCETTGQFGVAVTSSSICVASRCAFVRAGAGAALSQNVTDPSLGPAMLDLCAQGDTAAVALEKIVAETPHIQHRQLALLDSKGQGATFSGENALGLHASAAAPFCVAAGNLLDNTDVPQAIVDTFTRSKGELASRLIAALLGGQSAGGEAGPVKSAGLLVAADVSWPVVDLRVDWDETDPLAALEKLWTLYEPQAADYRTRALNPETAPSYGVPGDL